MSLWVGLGGAVANACVTLGTPDGVLGVCDQERVTRVRGAGFNSSGLPDEALDEMLGRLGRRRADIVGFAVAEDAPLPAAANCLRIDHHFSHACTAFLTSPFESATIVVCDHDAPEVSVWDGDDRTVNRVEWPWHGPGFATLYSQCAVALGFTKGSQEQRMEASARLDPTTCDSRFGDLFGLQSDRLQLARNWEERVSCEAGTQDPGGTAAVLAASAQSRIGDLLIDFLTEVKRRCPARRALCLGGSLFHNSYFNARIRLCGLFDDVFVPTNPGNGGLAVGGALYAVGPLKQAVSPFLGPAYAPEEIKATLDNCKVCYEWASESDVASVAVKALREGKLVGWFEGPMEWGPRALGARSILADPLSPYVLDNLNRFLKKREPWRGYALSMIEEEVPRYFEGPRGSPFMECDFVPRSRETFRHVLPAPRAAVRLHTVGAGAPRRFQALLSAFGAQTGIGALVNTSFNGFHEPIVCSPRDAVRVFFGTGVDMLVLDQFILRK